MARRLSRRPANRIRRAETAKRNANWRYEDRDYPRNDWAYEVKNGDTQLGYFDWVIHQIEANS